MPEETTQQATSAPSSHGSNGKGSAQAKQGGRGGGPALGVKVATSNGDPAKKPRSPALGRPCAYCKEAGHHINKCAKLIAKKAADGVGTGDGVGAADGDATKESVTKEAAEKKQYPCAYCKEVGHHINSCQKLATKKAQQSADGAQTLPSRTKGPDQGIPGPLNAVEPCRSLEHPSEDVPTTLAPSLIPMGPREGTPMVQSEGGPAHSPIRRRDGPPSANGVGPQAAQGIPSAPKIKITYTKEDEEDAMQIQADSTQKRRISGLGLSATAPAYHSARRSEATSAEQVPPMGNPSGPADSHASCLEEAGALSRPEGSQPKAGKGKGKGKAREPRGNGAGAGEEKGDRKAGKGERGKGDGSRGRGGDGRMRARGAAQLPAAPTSGGGASVAPPPGLRVVMPQEECDEAAIVKAKEEAEGRAAEAAAEAAEAEAEAARAREARLAAEREVARLDAEAAEAAKLETERRRAEAEAVEQERRKQMSQKVARAGTAFAALLMDSDMDEESSEEEEPAATPPPPNGASKAGRGRAAKEKPKAKPPPPDDRQPAPPAPAPAAPPRPPTPPPVWWGSEEHDAAQRFPLKLTTASHSKAGDTRIHANEDRYTMLVDLDAHLAKGDEPLEGPAAALSPQNSFFAVYDGHGGAGASTHAANRLHLHLNADADSWRLSPQDALLRAFTLTEAELRHTYDAVGEGKGRDKSGTCALVALLRGSRLFVGGLGDCRALLVRGDGHAQPFVQLTTDQRATESGEQARILKAGGQITDGRVWGALIPSRTLGDFPWKDRGPGLSATPDISAHEISADDKYLIMGSDGLFDVLSNKTIARIAGKMSSGAVKVCNELVKELRKRPGTDDVTLLVVQLGR